MNDGVDAHQCLLHRRRIPDIGVDEFKTILPLRIGGMFLQRVQPRGRVKHQVDDPDRMPEFQQMRREPAAGISKSARNQYFL